jgi:uncharacterized membrane protein
VTVGVVLAMLSLGVLIFFIHHVATSIQASRIIANVAEDLEAAIDRLFPEAIGEDSATVDPGGTSPDESDAIDEGAREVRATTTGYVQAVDAEGLMDIARERNVVVRVRARPGTFVRKGQVLLTVGPTPPHGDRDDKPFQKVFVIGNDRTGTQDVTFFMDQLVELAVRALSPGINDPGTARLCIDRIEQALCHLGGRLIPSPARLDDDGRMRVFACPLTFASILESALDEIAWYGRSSVSVTCRLLEAVRSVGSCVQHEADRRALLRQAAAIAGTVRESPFNERDRERIARCYRATLTALHEPADDGITMPHQTSPRH